MKTAFVVGIVLVCAASSAAIGENRRPDRMLRAEDLSLQCEGDFDQPPKLIKGRAPLAPISALNEDFIHTRWIKNLPLRWDMETTFQVGTDGKPTDIRTTRTDPPTFAGNMNAAVKAWRFEPASRDGEPVAATCTTSFSIELLHN